MNRFMCCSAGLVLALLLGGCVGVPTADSRAQVQAMVDARHAPAFWAASTAPASSVEAAVAALLAQPLDLDKALAIALLRNPRLRLEYAHLNIADADVLEASQLANPSLSLSALAPDRHGPTRLDAGIGIGLAELLLRPARQRLAALDYQRRQQQIAAALLELLSDVSTAWYADLGATQVAELRRRVADVAGTAAGLAGRYHDAGTLAALELQLREAAASEARLQALRATAEAQHTRATLNQLLGLSGSAAHWWRAAQLAAPPLRDDALEPLLQLAAAQRLDLTAARGEVAALEEGLALTQRYRWLGKLDIGIAGERDNDGTRLAGPTLVLQLPIFNHGQAAVLRAQAQLDQARAQVAALELAVDSAVRAGFDQVAAARALALEYRQTLLPQRKRIVTSTQAETNFNLAGVFELLLTRQQQYDAYQGYIEAVRDYWLARVALARAVGAALPSDTAGTTEPLIAPPLPGTEPPHNRPLSDARPPAAVEHPAAKTSPQETTP